jgi:hypothetical protein
VGGDPVRYTDPSGKWVNIVIGGVIGGGFDAAIQISKAIKDGKSVCDAINGVNLVQMGLAAVAGASGLGAITVAKEIFKNKDLIKRWSEEFPKGSRGDNELATDLMMKQLLVLPQQRPRGQLVRHMT